MKTDEIPIFLIISLNSCLIFYFSWVSKLLNGSSNNKSSGSIARDRARDTLCCCHPLNSLGYLLGKFSIFIVSNNSPTFFSLSFFRPNSIFSFTVKCGNS